MTLLTPYTKRDLGEQVGGAVLRNVIIAVVVIVVLLLVGCCRLMCIRQRRSRLKTEGDIVDVEQPAVRQSVANGRNQPINQETSQDPGTLAAEAMNSSDAPPIYSK
jgi:Tfp pilus assembly protein PilX